MDKSDLTNLKNKLNISGIVDSLKTMINPTGGVPDVDPDDDLGLKIAEISTLLKEMVEAQRGYVDNLNKVNALLNAAFQDIEKLRADIKPIRDAKKTNATSEAKTEDQK